MEQVQARFAVERLPDQLPGSIRRVTHGLYDLPKSHPLIGQVGANLEDAVKAVARKRCLRLLPTGAYAANRLGLSEQVPAKVIYITDGARSSFRLGKLEVVLRPGSARALALAERTSGLVAQAFRGLGKRHITPQHIRHLRRSLTAKAKRELAADLNSVPAWMRPHFREIAL
jgi:hypothetical protein